MLMIDLEGQSEAEMEACADSIAQQLKARISYNPSIDCYQVDGVYRYDVKQKPQTVALAS